MALVNLRKYRGRLADVQRIDRMTKWGNPYLIDPPYRHRDREHALFLYRQWLKGRLEIEPDFLEPLRGKTLACWCTPLPCHGDIILEMLEG